MHRLQRRGGEFYESYWILAPDQARRNCILPGLKRDGVVRRVATPEGIIYEYTPKSSANGSSKPSTATAPQSFQRGESPLQRYMRLHAEMKELAADLALLGVSPSPMPATVQPPTVPGGAQSSPSSGKQTAAKNAGAAAAPPVPPSSAVVESLDPLVLESQVLPDVAAALRDLQGHLLKWGGETEAAATKSRSKHTNRKASQQEAVAAARAAASLPPTELPPAPQAASKAPSAPPSGYISLEQAAQLENKIAHLEQRLWGSTEEDDTGVPLGQRVLDLQEHVRTADPKVLETATQQAKIFAAQMEAMPTGAGGAEDDADKVITDAQLDEALDLLLKWDSVRAAVPAVVRRMESLAELHASALHFHHRLAAAEVRGQRVHQALQENALVLSSLKSTMGTLAESAAHNANSSSGEAAPPLFVGSPQRQRAGSATSDASSSSSSSSSSDSGSGSGSDSGREDE